MIRLHQTPHPGEHRLHCQGDTIAFRLEADAPLEGEAFIRTDLGGGAMSWRELVAAVERGETPRGCAWTDLPMERLDDRTFMLTLLAHEVGRFEARAGFYLRGSETPLWPEGQGNVVTNVLPAWACGSNGIYEAFVRLFGDGGTLRDLKRDLDFILGDLRFRVLMLLPIFPVPTTPERQMGPMGSPYAPLDYFTVDPALAVFDRKATPLEQFRELTDATHARGARVFLDIPINHTGWDSSLMSKHPEWFVRDAESGAFASPGVWGVVWEDLVKLDYECRELWRYMAEVFLFWCGQGVDGFRCDAGHMIPLPVWRYIVAKVRLRFPDTVFLLEGLGASLETTDAMLDQANLEWAYSELFQKYTKPEIDAEIHRAGLLAQSTGILVHFSETHDNNRLASTSNAYARTRTCLAGLAAVAGGWGLCCGAEWLATDKIAVHRRTSLNWGSGDNLIDLVARLNALHAIHPAFQFGAHVRCVDSKNDQVVAFVRESVLPGYWLLVLINLDQNAMQTAVDLAVEVGFQGGAVYDLLSSQAFEGLPVALPPGASMCLSARVEDLRELERGLGASAGESSAQLEQRYHAEGARLMAAWGLKGPLDIQKFKASPERFCLDQLPGGCPRLVMWQWPEDTRREVMVPPGQTLFVRARRPFSVRLADERDVTLRLKGSLPGADGSHFAFLSARVLGLHRLRVSVYGEGEVSHGEGRLLFLPDANVMKYRQCASGDDVRRNDLYALCTNGRGAMAQVRGRWGEVRSQYDCLLAGNLHRDYPVDRRVMFTRCRVWIRYRDYSQELNPDALESFCAINDHTTEWRFFIPIGMRKTARITARLQMLPNQNAIALSWHRVCEEGVPAGEALTLIARVDLEDRSFHCKTSPWDAMATPAPDGVVFAPSDDHALHLQMNGGRFVNEPEWHQVVHPIEEERGLGRDSALFSPGYFVATLEGEKRAILEAHIRFAGEEEVSRPVTNGAMDVFAELDLGETALRAMPSFLVKRDAFRSLIAGYPWFLDWGRDTLIGARGLIAAGMLDETRGLLKTFGRFEENGTLPNMICGGDASNRDTSDAPLWFGVVCVDLIRAEDDPGVLDIDCGGRSLGEVLLSIGKHYVEGTPNGVRMDHESGLIYSPSHFTWMDTNHPACTPRQGYPIEIQALWHHLLVHLAQLDVEGPWEKLADKVRQSVAELYWSATEGRYLSDCLHGGPGQPAHRCEADRLLRSNQLLALTLGLFDDKPSATKILTSSASLLVPGAIRSLADDGNDLYRGVYVGPEETHRKPAYHNGTAWTWPFPSYSEALFQVYGESARETALAYLGSAAGLFANGCLGQLPEILDGDAPHAQRGCGAQAWGATEFYRVWKLLTS